MAFKVLLSDYRSRLSPVGTNIKEQYINLLENSFIDSFENNMNYRRVRYKKRNERRYFSIATHILQAKSDSENVGLDDYKRVVFKDLKFMPGRGDMLRFSNSDWLVLRVNTIDFIKSCIIGKCNNTVSLYRDGVKYRYPILVEDQLRLYQLGVDEGRYITEPSSVKVFRVSLDDITCTIKRGDVYKIGMGNYKITDVDDVLNPGIIVIKMKFSQEKQDEPIIDEPITTNYVIDGSDEVFYGDVEQYQAIKYIDGEFDKDAEFEFGIYGDTPEDKYILTIIDGQNCSIEARGYTHTIILRATDINGNNEDDYTEKEILLRGYF